MKIHTIEDKVVILLVIFMTEENVILHCDEIESVSQEQYIL